MKPTLCAIAAMAALTAGAGSTRADVLVGQGGEELFTLRAARDLDKSADERANDVYDRLRLVLNNPNLRASDIKVKKLGGYGAKIVANGQLIVPIGREEARMSDTTPMKLAQMWATRLRTVLPSLNARPDLFQVANTYPSSAVNVGAK